MLLRIFRLTLGICAALTALCPASQAAAAGQLQYGRYLGYVQLDGTERRVALTLDLFVVQPNDLTLFPQLNALVKASLGGPKGTEYVTQFYESLRYDYSNGIITFDSPGSDLTFTAVVKNDGGATVLEGEGFVRSAGQAASIHLVLPSEDDPDSPGAPAIDVAGDEPLLAGEYTGDCGGKKSALQLETARGISGHSVGTQGLEDYAIVGRLGWADGDVLCAEPLKCVVRSYTSGSYNLFSGRLTLDAGNGFDECQIAKDSANCTMRYGSTAVSCKLARKTSVNAPAQFSQRAYWLATTAAQKTKLPPLNPPANKDLIEALKGSFTGYLHNETTNRYQVMRLSTMAFTATDNPHNENLVSVSANAVLHFGNTVSSDFFVQPFAARTFYLTNGFTLEGPNADAFLQITDWRLGYVTGVWYSRAFGRVGTFELIKGSALPPLAERARFVPSLAATYGGPQGASRSDENAWWFKLLVPVPAAAEIDTSALAFKGEFQLADGAAPKNAIAEGVYDFYSGAVAWAAADGRIVTGQAADDGSLRLFWPGPPVWGVIMRDTHDLYPYIRQ